MVTRTSTRSKLRLKELKKKTRELELTRKTATISKELRILKVEVVRNIGTLANNKVRHGRKTYS